MTPKTKTRTPIPDRCDVAHELIPPHLDVPEEIADVAEAARAAAAEFVARRDEANVAGRAFAKAESQDRIARANAGPGDAPESTLPRLKAERDQANEREQTARDKERAAILAQRRAITPAVATAWRSGDDERVRKASEDVTGRIEQLVEALAQYEAVVALDHALKAVEHRQDWRLSVATPEARRRRFEKDVTRKQAAWENGGFAHAIPNQPDALVAALAVHARRWPAQRDKELAHEQRGEIVAAVEALKLPAAERDAEIRARCEAAGIPWRA